MIQTKTVIQFKKLLYLFKLALESGDANELESELIKMYELQEIYIEFLQLQLNYEYGNLEEGYFIEKSKEYLKLLEED